MRERVTVQLEERDSHIAQREAKKRLRSFKEDPDWDLEKRSFGVPAFDREYAGVMGELAFAQYAGLSIDANEYRRTDQGEDFYVEYQSTRCTIDVKAANKEPYALMIKEGTVSADYYVQGHLDDLTVISYGMATSEEVRAQELVDTPYEHRNYEIPVEELDPIPEPQALTPVG
jgi:hypothetical protein